MAVLYLCDHGLVAPEAAPWLRPYYAVLPDEQGRSIDDHAAGETGLSSTSYSGAATAVLQYCCYSGIQRCCSTSYSGQLSNPGNGAVQCIQLYTAV